MSRWAIYLTASGELVQTFVSPTHPRFNGFDWQSGIHTATAIGDAIDPAVQSWSRTAKSFAEDVAKVEALLLAGVKAEADRRKMAIVSRGDFKPTEYAEKRAEVIAWEALGNSDATRLAAFNLLEGSVRALRFEWAIADAARFGDPSPIAAITRFRTAIVASGSIPALGAIEAKIAADIRAATTPAAKRAAAIAAWSVTS